MQQDGSRLIFAMTVTQARKLGQWSRSINAQAAQAQVATGKTKRGFPLPLHTVEIVRRSIEDGNPQPYCGTIGGDSSVEFCARPGGLEVKGLHSETSETLDLTESGDSQPKTVVMGVVDGEFVEKLATWKRSIEERLAQRQPIVQPKDDLPPADGHRPVLTEPPERGTYVYHFAPTSIGTIQTVRNVETGESLDLTDDLF